MHQRITVRRPQSPVCLVCTMVLLRGIGEHLQKTVAPASTFNIQHQPPARRLHPFRSARDGNRRIAL